MLARLEDKIFYSRDKIVRVINPPSVAGNRGQFVFEDIIKYYMYVNKSCFV